MGNTGRRVPVRVPSSIEPRWPCPVCTGTAMEKARLDGPVGRLALDYCPRCGGLWFDRGEVALVARGDPEAVQRFVPQRIDRIRPPCAECLTPLDRDAERCGACGHRNVLGCPVCDRPMERRAHNGLVLDVCRHCHGVWFDNAELSAVWRMSLTSASAAPPARGSQAITLGGDALLDAAFWAPDLVFDGGVAVGEAVSHLAGPAAEAVGHAAEGVFSFVLEILASVFDGL